MPLIPRDYSALEYSEGTYGYELYDVNIGNVGTGEGGLITSPRMSPPPQNNHLITNRRMHARPVTAGLIVNPRHRRIG